MGMTRSRYWHSLRSLPVYLNPDTFEYNLMVLIIGGKDLRGSRDNNKISSVSTSQKQKSA